MISRHRLCSELKVVLEDDPPPKGRAKLANNRKRWSRWWLKKRYKDSDVKEFVQRVRNGFGHRFTFATIPGIEPTNNRAERVLPEHVVQRKIMGTLSTERGVRVYETLTSLIATWKLRGLNPAQAMSEALTIAWTKG